MGSNRRKTTIELADSSYERVIAKELSRLFAVIPPVAGWFVTLVLGFILHVAFPDPLAVAGLTATGCALAALSLHLAHQRKTALGRYLGAVTDLAVFSWLAAITGAGWTRGVLGAWCIGGLWLVASWCHWLHIRGSSDQIGIGQLFDQAAEHTSVSGMRLIKLKLSERKAASTHQLRPGDTAGDVVKAASQIESAAKLPPGSLAVSVNEDRADHVDIVLSDPRVLKAPQPWPGPYRPGGSIEEPLRIGLRQDAEYELYTILNHHLLLMGATGSGKTEGGAYGEIAETVSRRDAGVIAIDITKGEQFLGPLRPALHYFETEKPAAKRRLQQLHRLVRAQTDFLAAQHLGKWKKNCGLLHLTWWLEEAPDILNLLSDAELDDFISDCRSARSAGIRIVLSCQRSDWTQVPTIIRAQMAKMCFGVLDDQDAAFGLSPYQKEHDCTPELWGASRPGMHYLDATCIPQPAKTMSNRSWYWGESTAKIAEYAQAHPASERKLHPVQLAVLEPAAAQASPPPREEPQPRTAPPAGTGPLHSVPRQEEAPAMYVTDPDDDDSVISAEELAATADAVDDGPLPAPAETGEIDDLGAGDTLAGWTFAPDQEQPPKMTTDEARAELRQQIAAWRVRGTRTFGIAELADLRDRIGRSRPWLYGQLDELDRIGEIRKINTYPAQWDILDAA